MLEGKQFRPPLFLKAGRYPRSVPSGSSRFPSIMATISSIILMVLCSRMSIAQKDSIPWMWTYPLTHSPTEWLAVSCFTLGSPEYVLASSVCTHAPGLATESAKACRVFLSAVPYNLGLDLVLRLVLDPDNGNLARQSFPDFQFLFGVLVLLQSARQVSSTSNETRISPLF